MNFFNVRIADKLLRKKDAVITGKLEDDIDGKKSKFNYVCAVSLRVLLLPQKKKKEKPPVQMPHLDYLYLLLNRPTP